MTRHGMLALPATKADLWLARQAVRIARPPLERGAQAVTLVADEKLLLAAAGLAWAGVRMLKSDAVVRNRVDHLAWTVAASAVLPHLLKCVISRKRPDRVVVGEPRHGVPRSGKPYDSFPSGHAMHLGAVAAALARWVPGPARPVVWAAAGGLAATRLVLLAHWLSDVGAGLAIGVGLEASLHRLRTVTNPADARAADTVRPPPA